MPVPSIEEFKQTIREAGLRATPARIATLDILHRATTPLSHADVAEQLDERGINATTAYRNLSDMTDTGLLRRTELGDHVWRFELIREGAPERADHPLFICVDCGSVTCLYDIKLTEKGMPAGKRIGKVTEIWLRGHCKNCI